MDFYDVTVYFKVAVPTLRPHLCNCRSATLAAFVFYNTLQWQLADILIPAVSQIVFSQLHI